MKRVTVILKGGWGRRSSGSQVEDEDERQTEKVGKAGHSVPRARPTGRVTKSWRANTWNKWLNLKCNRSSVKPFWALNRSNHQVVLPGDFLVLESCTRR